MINNFKILPIWALNLKYLNIIHCLMQEPMHQVQKPIKIITLFKLTLMENLIAIYSQSVMVMEPMDIKFQPSSKILFQVIYLLNFQFIIIF